MSVPRLDPMPADRPLTLRSARTQDVPVIQALVEPLARERVLLQKEAVASVSYTHLTLPTNREV